MKRAFFFDRDGTINLSPGPGYVLRWEDFKFMPGAREMVAAVALAGWTPILVTNQQCVGKGSITRAELDAIHDRMQTALQPWRFAGIQVCPHLAGTCDCRKPAPTMILDAAAEHGIDLAASWNVGDNEHDLEMGRRAGVGTNIRIGSAEFPNWEVIRRHWETAVSAG